MTAPWKYLLAGLGIGWLISHVLHCHEHGFLAKCSDELPDDPGSLFRVVLADGSPSPAPTGAEPAYGLASALGARWMYVVQKDDSAGSIASRITGSSARYQELLLANPDIPKIGKPGVFRGEQAWNFAPGSLLASRTALRIPEVWTPWIDQMGFGRGALTPWKPDLREPSAIVTVETTSGSSADRQYGVPRGLLRA